MWTRKQTYKLRAWQLFLKPLGYLDQVDGCVQFTWANRWVHGLGNWHSKFRTGKFRLGIASTIVEMRWFTEKRPRMPETGIKDDWRGWKRISDWNIPCGKRGLPFQMFRCSRKFSAGMTQKVVFHLLSNWIFQKILVNGNQPIYLIHERRNQAKCDPNYLPWSESLKMTRV